MAIELPVLPDLRLGLVPPNVGPSVEVAMLLADRNRMAILALLRSGPHCVCEMAAALGSRENNVSNHLARLRDAGLVKAARVSPDQRRVYYERDEAAVSEAIATLIGVVR